MRIFYSLILILMGMPMAFSQSAIVPLGGDSETSGGSVNFTVGQIAVQNSNNCAFYVAEGVQQPYEIMTVRINNHSQIILNAVIYPNPTENLAQLQLNDFEFPLRG